MAIVLFPFSLFSLCKSSNAYYLNKLTLSGNNNEASYQKCSKPASLDLKDDIGFCFNALRSIFLYIVGNIQTYRKFHFLI